MRFECVEPTCAAAAEGPKKPFCSDCRRRRALPGGPDHLPVTVFRPLTQAEVEPVLSPAEAIVVRAAERAEADQEAE